MLNCVTLTGRLTSAPIPRGTGDRLAAAFTLAVQRDYKDKDGERGVDFVDCVAFGKLGEHVLGYFDKGKMMALKGRLVCGTYIDRDGQQRKSWQVIADNCYFCDSKPASAAAYAAASSAAATSAAPAAAAPAAAPDYYDSLLYMMYPG